MSSGSYSTNQEKDEYGGGQGSGGYGGGGAQYGNSQQQQQQPMVEGMTMQPSVGRFTEMERGGNVSMFARTPVMPPLTNTLLSQDSNSNSSQSSSSISGGIVNLRAAPRAEGKMNKNAAKKKK